MAGGSSNKKSGMKKSLAKETYKKVQSYIDRYETAMNKLYKAEVAMNKEAWYGGKVANKQYKSLQGNYKNSVDYLKKLKKLQNSIHSYYANAESIKF